MALRDFFVLVLICLVWAFNNIVSKIVVAEWGVPPLFYAAVRFALVALCTLPWLFPAPKPTLRLIVVALLMGGGNFALLFIGLKTASPSAAAIVIQLGVPITTVLSMFMLGEKVRWRRGIGMALTLAGAMVVMWHGSGMSMSLGLWLVAAWPFLGAVVFSAVVLSVVGHTLFYGLLQKYEATLISPLTLMTPLATIGMGVAITHDHFDLRMAIGATLALLGVLIIALRPNRVMPLLMSIRNRSQ